jgi:hypothetical protein
MLRSTRSIASLLTRLSESDFNQEHLKSMVNRKGVFIGAYVPNDLKETLRRRAAAEHRTLSQEITRILTEAVHGKTLPPGATDRRNPASSQPRRRDSDPPERRRRDDVPYKGTSPGDASDTTTVD